jgi:hypothetical protein
LQKAAADKAVADFLASKARPAIEGYLSTLDGAAAQTQISRTDPALDSLPLPTGNQVSDLTPGELATLLVDVGVPNVSHSNGKRANLESYAAFLDGIKKPAIDAALAQFARGK